MDNKVPKLWKGLSVPTNILGELCKKKSWFCIELITD